MGNDIREERKAKTSAQLRTDRRRGSQKGLHGIGKEGVREVDKASKEGIMPNWKREHT